LQHEKSTSEQTKCFKRAIRTHRCIEYIIKSGGPQFVQNSVVPLYLLAYSLKSARHTATPYYD